MTTFIDLDELMDELDCPVNTEDYNTIPLRRPTPVKQTFSIVEVHQPSLAPLKDPGGAIARKMPLAENEAD